MLCNTRVKWDFQPELTINGTDKLQIVDEIKVVGYIMRNDMKTSSNTAYLIAKAYKRMWIIRRLKDLGASTAQLIDSLQKQVLSVLWLGAPAWFCQLTQCEKADIDRVAKVALRIIYGDKYGGFESALHRSALCRPTLQMAKMTHNFAKKCAKNDKFSKWFEPVPESRAFTRTNQQQKYIHISARTNRFANSPIPHLTQILNTQVTK